MDKVSKFERLLHLIIFNWKSCQIALKVNRYVKLAPFLHFPFPKHIRVFYLQRHFFREPIYKKYLWWYADVLDIFSVTGGADNFIVPKVFLFPSQAKFFRKITDHVDFLYLVESELGVVNFEGNIFVWNALLHPIWKIIVLLQLFLYAKGFGFPIAQFDYSFLIEQYFGPTLVINSYLFLIIIESYVIACIVGNTDGGNVSSAKGVFEALWLCLHPFHYPFLQYWLEVAFYLSIFGFLILFLVF